MKLAALRCPAGAQLLFGATTELGSQVTHSLVLEGCHDSLAATASSSHSTDICWEIVVINMHTHSESEHE